MCLHMNVSVCSRKNQGSLVRAAPLALYKFNLVRLTEHIELPSIKRSLCGNFLTAEDSLWLCTCSATFSLGVKSKEL